MLSTWIIRRLVSKLASYGIRGEVLRWVKAFLNNWRQRVVVNGKSSEWTDVTSGVYSAQYFLSSI